MSGCTVAGQLLELVEQDTGLCDFYLVCNGRIVNKEELLQDGSVYRLEPRLKGGKGGFGSMLRALGAQIEKTTNREACRDLSGRRLRDVNHEKEMAEWLKKQSEREAEKEQRRLERLQKKLAEPKHNFTDSQYTQQCHELSERLEDSVMKGLQASCSSAVRAETSKRPSEEGGGPENKRSKGNFSWTGIDLDSDEDLDEGESTGSEEEEAVSRGAESEDSGQGSSSAPSGDSSTRTSSSPRSTSRPDQQKPESFCTTDQGDPQTTCEPNEVQGDSSLEQVQSKPESGSSPDHNRIQEQQPLDLDSVSCVEDLEAMGLNVLKEELLRRGLKCGGTLSERAARLFSVKGKCPEDIDPAIIAKTKKKSN